MKKKILIAVLIAGTAGLGFLRDYIFVSINRFIDSGNDVNGQLLMLKWVLTALFYLLYLLDSCAFLYILFPDRQYIKIAIFSYGLLLAVALSAGIFGYYFSSFAGTYPFIRTILGVAQSPIVMMVLIAACQLELKFQKE